MIKIFLLALLLAAPAYAQEQDPAEILAALLAAQSVEVPDDVAPRYRGEVIREPSFAFEPTAMPGTCTDELRGTVYFDDTFSAFCFCNGAAWCVIGSDCGTATACIVAAPTPTPGGE